MPDHKRQHIQLFKNNELNIAEKSCKKGLKTISGTSPDSNKMATTVAHLLKPRQVPQDRPKLMTRVTPSNRVDS